MSTGEASYSEYVPVPRRRGPAFGELGPPPEVDEKPERAGPLEPRVEAALAVAIFAPVCAMYVALAYGLYVVVGSI
jgi:hypothetical protein